MSRARRRRNDDSPIGALFVLLFLLFSYVYQPVRIFLQQPFNFALTVGGIATFTLWLVLYVWKRIRIRKLKKAIDQLALGGVRDLYFLSPIEFEHATAAIFRSRGYKAVVTQGSGDRGIDINLEKEGENFAVQCKRYDPTTKKVGSPDIRDFVGAMDGAGFKKGFFVTTSTFSEEAKAAAKNSSFTITLVDGKTLAKAQANVREQLAQVKKSINTDLIPIRGWSQFPNWQRFILFCLGFGTCWMVVFTLVFTLRG